MTEYNFHIDGQVLEAELDQIGHVHHHRIAEWLHNGRVEYLKARSGLYEGVLDDGYVPHVTNLEMSFIKPIRRDMQYRLLMALERRGARYVFETKIVQLPDLEELATTKAELVFTKDGHVAREDVLQAKTA